MKFFGNGVVWDAERSKALCSFGKEKEFETEDKRTIDILVKLGYEHDGIEEVEGFEDIEDVEDIEEVIEELEKEVVEDIKNYEEMTNRELKSILEAKGYLNLERKNKTQLLTMLEGD